MTEIGKMKETIETLDARLVKKWLRSLFILKIICYRLLEKYKITKDYYYIILIMTKCTIYYDNEEVYSNKSKEKSKDIESHPAYFILSHLMHVFQK